VSGVLLFFPVSLCAVAMGQTSPWEADFARQPLSSRPRLETRYVTSARTAAEVLAQTYQLRLDFGSDAGHRATVHTADGGQFAELWLEVEASDGTIYSSRLSRDASRINLYRRGPYYHEVHWFDVTCTAEDGTALPARGEVVLHCYPEKTHIQAILHAEGEVSSGIAQIVVRPSAVVPAGLVTDMPDPGADGLLRSSVAFGGLGEGGKASVTAAFALSSDAAFPVELIPPPGAPPIELLDGVSAAYDPVRGCYVVTTDSPGGFNFHFYENPNHYETARFRLANGPMPRKVYICHATRNSPGSVECGVVLDAEGNPLPITVQISKNFAGEKEEPFYNPTDTPFSETLFPLHLAAGETREVTSLHLYQNWGNHPLKQFSSLGAWMDYYHSSTGVTETTCFVPFKFGGLPGVAIADLRAMSQPMWASQPQHDNVAGHRFLMVQSGGEWHYAEYRGTEFRSTGPNWMDISLDYLLDDGRIRARLDSFELPQTDELRNFLRLRCEVLAPVSIADLATDFRLMDITSAIQALRYKWVAWQSGPGQVETRELHAADEVAAPGVALGGDFPWATVYGDKRGCNSFVVRRFAAQLGGEERGPAMVCHTTRQGDSHLALTVAGGAAELKPGDFVEAEFTIMPYGTDQNQYETPERDRIPFGEDAPRVLSVATGLKLADFPARIRAEGGTAEFTIRGGVNTIPVIIEGLPTYRSPRLEERVDGRYVPVAQSAVGEDGFQVFVDDEGTFGCVFLVNADGREHTYRLAQATPSAIEVKPLSAAPGDPHRNIVLIQAPWMDAPMQLRYPETINAGADLLYIDHIRADMPSRTDTTTLPGWHEGPGRACWFDWPLYGEHRAGGTLSPRGDVVDLDFWFRNAGTEPTTVLTQFCLVQGDGALRDPTGERTFVRSGGKWLRMADGDRGLGDPALVDYATPGGQDLRHMAVKSDTWGVSTDPADCGLVAVQHPDGRHVVGLAFPRPRYILSNWHIPCMHADPTWPVCGPGDRVSVHGKVYLIEGALDDLWSRYCSDFPQ